MTQFDPTTDGQISRKISEQVERPRIGRVKQVFEHTQDSDNSNFEVDVQLIATSGKQHRAIPWQSPHTGEVKVPKVGDKVVVEYRSDAKKSPIARNAIYTNNSRPPLAKAGMWRRRVESDSSPAGDGDLYVETYTEYDDDPATSDFEEDSANPQSSFIRLAKKLNDDDDPNDGDTIPVMFELFDNPSGDEAHIELELNKKDGADTTNTWGVRFDLKTGEMKILDADGYGIESDGSGNFTWHYETLTESVGTTTSL